MFVMCATLWQRLLTAWQLVRKAGRELCAPIKLLPRLLMLCKLHATATYSDVLNWNTFRLFKPSALGLEAVLPAMWLVLHECRLGPPC